MAGTDLEGFASKNLDEKDRVGLSSRHTRLLTGEIVLSPGPAHCIEARSIHEWERHKTFLQAAAARGPRQRRELLRHVIGHAVHARIDAQGRVRVHPELLKWAGIPTQHGSDGREIKIIGVGAYLELWSCGVYESRRQTSEADFEDTYDEMLQEQSAPSDIATLEDDGQE